MSTQIRRQHFSQFAFFCLILQYLPQSASRPTSTSTSTFAIRVAATSLSAAQPLVVIQFSSSVQQSLALSVARPSICSSARLSFHLQLCAWIYDFHMNSHTHTRWHRLAHTGTHWHSHTHTRAFCIVYEFQPSQPLVTAAIATAVHSSIKYENLSIILCNMRQLLNF